MIHRRPYHNLGKGKVPYAKVRPLKYMKYEDPEVKLIPSKFCNYKLNRHRETIKSVSHIKTAIKRIDMPKR